MTSQGKDGYIIVFGWLARELLDPIENGRADFRRGLRLGALKIVLDLVQSKFFRPTLRLDDSPRHKHQCVPGLESDYGCFRDDMGKQSQGQACSRQFNDARSIKPDGKRRFAVARILRQMNRITMVDGLWFGAQNVGNVSLSGGCLGGRNVWPSPVPLSLAGAQSRDR